MASEGSRGLVKDKVRKRRAACRSAHRVRADVGSVLGRLALKNLVVPFGPELNIKCSKSGGAKLKGLSRGKVKWRILGNEGSRKRKSSAGDHGRKRKEEDGGRGPGDGFRGRKKVENEKSRQ